MGGDARVGPYRILRLINRGGQGSVYLGYDQRLQRRVAIKIYALPSRRAARKDLRREAQLVASLDSPGIVRVHDIIESPEHLALVMEYVPGCDLEEFLCAVRPSLSSVLSIAGDIAAALAVVRQQRIVHGDLKAANVLIASSGRVKLTDFGIARSSADTSRVEAVAGSWSALSPEHYLGEPLDVRSDLFSLGCLLYRMLAGERPFCRDGQLDVQWLLQRPPQPLEQRVDSSEALPRELLDLVARLLEKKPGDRPRNTHQVRQILRRTARSLPLSQGSSLLRQARPCFRQESPEDIPPQVPPALGREGRSLLANRGAGRWRGVWRGRIGRKRALALAVLLGLAATPLVIALQGGVTPVYISQPSLRLKQAQGLPAELTTAWLVEQLKAELRQQLGPVRVSGPVGATPVEVYYAGGDRAEIQPRENLGMTLRCAAEFCALIVSRDHGSGQRQQQALLFPDMTIAQWGEIIRSTTAGLYQ